MPNSLTVRERKAVRCLVARLIPKVTERHGAHTHPNAKCSSTAANYNLGFTTVQERFIARMAPGQYKTIQRPRVSGLCKLWPGQMSNTGYGKLRLVCTPDIHILTHVLVARIHLCDGGPIPDGMQVNHTCDTRMCCNYRHLYLGSHKMNMSDLRHRGSYRSQLLLERRLREAR